jgi:GT2 family glycosyltransferase
MWAGSELRPPFALWEVEATSAHEPLTLREGEGGAHVLVRHGSHPVGRFWLTRARHGSVIGPSMLEAMIAAHAERGIASLAERILPSGDAATLAITVAVCTRDRPSKLHRCLAALVALRDARRDARRIDILVIDNAPTNRATRTKVEEFPDVRYVVEPVPGLDFARNRAIAASDHPWLAFVDDDVVVDRCWFDRVAEAIAGAPDAGGFTGPVLPLVLETEAQLRFERAGGFGKGFETIVYGRDRPGDPIYPAHPGSIGTGACMVFATAALRSLGGFDEALDTGPPLPGGGDIDMFYRMVRAGHTIVYLPGLLVHHEHRREMKGLRKQYYSWGLSVMTLMQKNRRSDPAMRDRHRRMLRVWRGRYLRCLAVALTGRGVLPPSMPIAMLWGGAVGYVGAYERSVTRVAQRKAAAVANQIAGRTDLPTAR